MEKDRRVALGKKLRACLNPKDQTHVHFQPGPNITLAYPAIVYERDDTYEGRANNKLYLFKQRYQVTLLDKDPDSPALKKLLELENCTFDRHFATSDLNHDVFVIYY